MLTISAMNSFIPCLESCDTLFTAILNLDLGNSPLYTLPNPPVPRRFLLSNPSVARNKSLYENRCGPNSTSQSSCNSAYLKCLRTSRETTAATDRMSAAVASGRMICNTCRRRRSLVWGPGGNLGSMVRSMAGAGLFMPKLQPIT
uniref:Uncharacterized protein n=1 Tax=Triticum urartu TaxID=4572 RepID=A0A8R7UYE6_TRIUA